MQSSKYNNTGLRKEEQLPQQDSDGSGSVVSLPSTSSDDGRYPRIQGQGFHSEGASMPISEVDSGEEIGLPKEAGRKSNDDATRQNVGKLQQKLHVQPTQNTLDEIISTLKNQNGIKNPPSPGMSLPVHNDPTVGMKTFNGSLAWNSSPLQMSGHQKFNEKHGRQLKDITSYFEAEVGKICEQLNTVGGSLKALQDALPVRMLEAANHKLEARCNVLEQVCEQMKNKSTRLEQANHELDSNCGQLRQINQDLEARCLYLEQVANSNESEKSGLQESIKDLEAKVLVYAESNEKALSTCKQLEELNQQFAAKNQQLEESESVLEQRYKSCVGENQKLDTQIAQYEKILEESKKRLGNFEEAIVTSKREKETLAVKLESQNKGNIQLKLKYDELKATSVAKDELIARLENEMREQMVFVDKTIKEKAEAEGNSKRDKELLQRMLVEYDVLARDHQDANKFSKAIHDKLELSQSEMSSLRETISKLVSRNKMLEQSAKQDLIQDNSITEQPTLTSKNKPFTGRKTWDQSTPIKKQYQSTPYKLVESTRDALSSDIASCQPPDSTLATPRRLLPSAVPAAPDVTRASTSSGRGQDFSAIGAAKTSTPLNQGKRNQGKSPAVKGSPDQSTLSTYSTPVGMVVKKTDLMTRFDVVFEDSQSGEELIRTHTGRTRRLYGEPPQTEMGFVTTNDDASGGVRDSTFSADRNEKDGRLSAVDDRDSGRTDLRKSKPKQIAMSNVAEKDFGFKGGQLVNKNREEETDQHNISLMERKFAILTEERKWLESTLSRIPNPQKMSKRAKEDKAYLESRLQEVEKDIGVVRNHLRKRTPL